MASMFVGEYTHSIDDKGRLTIPAKFRADFETGLYVTSGLDQCLWVYTRDEWERFSEQLAKLPSLRQDTRALTRFFFSQATDAIPDRQGRILLPENLRRFANLDGNATIIGANNKVEIWQPERWNTFIQEQMADMQNLAAQLSEFGI